MTTPLAPAELYRHGLQLLLEKNIPGWMELWDPDVKIHQTTTPETIVVEMRGVGRLVETDSPYDMTYIAVVTVQDGRMTSYRDYWNPLAVQKPGSDFVGAN